MIVLLDSMSILSRVNLNVASCFSTGRYWEMVQRLKLTHLFTTPTNIKQLMKAGNTYVKAYDRSSLKMLISGKTYYK